MHGQTRQSTAGSPLLSSASHILLDVNPASAIQRFLTNAEGLEHGTKYHHSFRSFLLVPLIPRRPSARISMEPSNHNLPIVALQQPSHPYDDDAQRLEDDPLLASLPRGSSASGPSRRQSGPSVHHFGSLDSPLGQERYHYFQPAPIARDSISSSSSSSSSSMHPPPLVPSSGQSGLHNYHISAPPGFQLAPITPPAGSPALSDHQGPIDRRQSESQGAATSTPNDSAPAALGSKAPAQPHLKKQQACLTCKRRKVCRGDERGCHSIRIH